MVYLGYVVSNKTTDGYKYGYIDYKHKLVLDVEYDAVNRIVQNKDTNDIYIIACKNGQYGVVKNNKILINYEYLGIEYDNSNKFFEVQRNGKYGILNYDGKVIIPTQYNEIQVKGIYVQALKNDEEYYFNTVGEEIKDLKYTSVIKTSNDNYNITINKDGFYGIINNKNEELIENKYNYLEYLFNEYFIAAKENGKLGIIDINNNIMADFNYDVLQKVEDTKVAQAKILKENKSELYSENMEKICTVKNSVVYKEDNYIKVYSSEDVKYFDVNGNELENKVVFSSNKLLANKSNVKWGFVDRNGRVVVDYDYDKVTEFNKYGYAGIEKDEMWGIIDTNGNIVLEPTYKLDKANLEPEFLGKYYKVYYGYGECYYTDKVNE